MTVLELVAVYNQCVYLVDSRCVCIFCPSFMNIVNSCSFNGLAATGLMLLFCAVRRNSFFVYMYLRAISLVAVNGFFVSPVSSCDICI